MTYRQTIRTLRSLIMLVIFIALAFMVTSVSSAQEVLTVHFQFGTADIVHDSVIVIAEDEAFMRTSFVNSITGQQEQVDQVMTVQVLPNDSGFAYQGTNPTYADTTIPHPTYQPDIVYFLVQPDDNVQVLVVDAVTGMRFIAEVLDHEWVDLARGEPAENDAPTTTPVTDSPQKPSSRGSKPATN